MVAARHENNRAYSYIRFSTPEQAKGDSLRRQTELSEQYALKHGLILDDKLTFRDLGKSGFRGKNMQEGELGAFIAAVESGKVKRGSYLLVENLDRLSRQPARKALRQLERIVESGIVLVTLHDNRVYTESSLDENFWDLQYALNVLQRGHEESTTKSKRGKASWAARRKAAIENGTPMTSSIPAWITKDAVTGKFKPIPERVKVVRKIFNEASKGNGQHAIAHRFNRERVPLISTKKRNLKGWHASYIQKILCNPAVIGHFQPHKMGPNGQSVPDGDVIQDYYPPVINERLYYSVRDMRVSRRNPSGPKGSNGGNLFTGLARCKACGAAMRKTNTGAKGGSHQYLVCWNAIRGNGWCAYRSWRLNDYELGILTCISDKVDWRNLGKNIEEHSEEAMSQLEAAYTTKCMERDRVGRTLKAISADIDADHAEGRGTSPTLRESLHSAEKKEAALSQEIANIQERLAIERDKADHAKASVKDASEALLEWIIEQRHDSEQRDQLKVLLSGLIEVILFDPEEGGAIVVLRHNSPKQQAWLVKPVPSSPSSSRIMEVKAVPRPTL